MPFGRRKEPLHERLAREGGLEFGDPRPKRSWWDELVGIHGVHRQRTWDFVGAAEAPGLRGDQVSFVALPDEDFLVEEGEGDVEPLAEAVEARLEPPYRAHGVRRDGDVWAVAANRIQVEKLERVGDELEEVVEDEEGTFVRRGRRLEGDLWEVEVSRL